MINDNNKDQLFLADSVPVKHPKFYNNFIKILKENKIKFTLLGGTKDIWCRDYMPIQNAAGEFIQFSYQPDYLKSPRYGKTITNVNAVCKKLKIKTIKSKIVLDGGNIVYCGGKIIMCDKVLKENKQIPEKELTETIRRLLRVNHVFLIPSHPEDILGHADGILRFIDKRTVLVSDFSKTNPAYWKELIAKLQKIKLKIIPLPCITKNNKSNWDATGFYINFIQMKKIIFLPTFGLKEDKLGIEVFRKYFPKEKIVPVPSKDISKEGGVLNCISWTIKSNYPKELSEYEKEVERDIRNLELEYYFPGTT